ncbi:phosphotransferase family protein [Pseudotabrizicola alkalilacus]|uniref:LPS biosynthesis choline kinase n=1 Tax=Pseudotabrizicola alkalilacus TaxID=2305252 RepID=A0A411YY92_9RHOB|nr:phosphotransferase family protein [Pseudotabrizicola alkalilacus]RGP35758.1 LPS biosynthesis choline kinase [Pseudotabrizicola alkalilacus]
MPDDIAGLIAEIPMLAGWSGPAQRLGGLTNRVYRLGEAILRVPGEGTADYIDRTAEAVAAEAAAQAGVSPAVLYNDPASGLMVTRYVADTVTMTPNAFRARPGAPARAALALRQLHQSGQVFATRFELFAMIDDYLRLLSGKDVALPDGYHAVVREAEAVRAALARTPVPLAPCHCDPLCENFLDTGSRMWIVDWEYAGMNDPMWDLGDLSVEAGFDEGQDEALLAAYFNGPAPPQDQARMVIYKAMCDLLWTLWGLIQLANHNPADDFQAYADGRFARCRALMATPGFARHLAVLQAS